MAGETYKPKRIMTRHLNADPPGAFIFVCACGHKRRVTHSETNFRCERGGVGPSCECDIIWYRKQRPTEEVDENGQTIYEDETVKEPIEVVDEFSGKKSKKMVDVPVFYGRKVGEVRAEEFKRRRDAGQPIFANPSDHVNLKQVGGEKPAAKSGEGIFKK